MWPLVLNCLGIIWSDKCVFRDMKTFNINLCLVSGGMTNWGQKNMFDVDNFLGPPLQKSILYEILCWLVRSRHVTYTLLAISRLPVNYRLTRRGQAMSGNNVKDGFLENLSGVHRMGWQPHQKVGNFSLLILQCLAASW